jgi:hypothetical protein
MLENKYTKESHFLTAVVPFLKVCLMTPTATVCFMSLTANLPNGGYSWNDSHDIGFDGVRMIKAESPFLMNFGSSSIALPVLLSILDWISVNLQAM